MSSSDVPEDYSIRVQQNFDMFRELIAARKGDLKAICGGLAKLVVVDIALNRDQDNPQLIFESMNSTGRELSQADLIRNFILMGLEPTLQTRLYEQFWRPMEVAFGQEAYNVHFDAFMRHYLTLKSTGDIPFRSRSYWLRRFENFGRKERVSVDEYTIEHIMPQNDELPAAWRAALGPDWQRVHEAWLHTLGNLTLTGYNSEYSDKPFAAKRDMAGGFKESPLKVNAGLGQLESWNEATIKERAATLAATALGVWPAPTLPAEVLAAYRPKSTARESYTLEDHPHLISAAMRDLFAAFRKEVLALDPCVTEEFLKLYVAYKAETNFVDVVPQAKQLRLSLNMRFAEISDPKGICKDVSGLGRWGNGDVEVRLSSLEELPYVMGLIRQSLERQLGVEEAA